MNPIIHFFGISVKYIGLNGKAFIKYLQCKNNNLDFFKIDTIVFTHNLGGGTESYIKNNFYEDNILIVRLISYRNDKYFSIENKNDIKVLCQKKLFNLLDSLRLKKIIVNSLNAYSNPKVILDYIKNKKTECNISYLIHDFHATCKTGMFIQRNKFCNYQCQKCSISKLEIHAWNGMWNDFLMYIDEIICFSESSKEILSRFYPKIEAKIKVIPHSMDYCNFRKLDISGYKNIGIIGNCSSVAKGKLVIKNLTREINKQQERKLFIVGKNPYLFAHNTKFVKFTGKYDLKNLPETIISGQIGVIVFTSILPETFSYAISEFMLLGIPIVSLDLGAQGEKLHKYEKAVFVDDLTPSSILEGVEKCFI